MKLYLGKRQLKKLIDLGLVNDSDKFIETNRLELYEDRLKVEKKIHKPNQNYLSLRK